MKLKDSRDLYYFYSGKVSDISRQLGFAAIAVVWLFKISVTGTAGKINPSLQWPLVLVIFSLLMDVVQYLYASAAWGIFNRYQEEKKRKEEDEFLANEIINWPTIFLFWSKVILMAIAYALIARFLLKEIF
ncbi:MAG: hypothetical protein JWQ10_4007 [Herbaspirillum sp.]|nr:hypothetical protein [Herbaspirillum sp.]